MQYILECQRCVKVLCISGRTLRMFRFTYINAVLVLFWFVAGGAYIDT